MVWQSATRYRWSPALSSLLSAGPSHSLCLLYWQTGLLVSLLVNLSVYWSTHQSIGQPVSLLVNPVSLLVDPFYWCIHTPPQLATVTLWARLTPRVQRSTVSVPVPRVCRAGSVTPAHPDTTIWEQTAAEVQCIYSVLYTET